MNALNRILAVTDLSAPARHALERAFQLAEHTQAHFTIAHAIELDMLDALRDWMADEFASVKNKLEQEVRSTLGAQLALISKHYKADADTRVICGPRLKVIADLADQLAIDLLVLGARGQGFLKHHVLGSTASRLIRKSVKHPVLVVKRPPQRPYQRVLIPVDFSAASVSAVKAALKLTPNADYTLLHAFQVPFEGKIAYAGVDEDIVKQYRISTRDKALMQIRQIADAAGLDVGDYTPLIVHGDPSQVVLDQEQQLEIDLIVMGKHGKGFTEALLLGSATKYVLEASQCDVLVVEGGASETDVQTSQVNVAV